MDEPWREPGNLYLLEDARHPDTPGYDWMSSFSALSLMLGGFPAPGGGSESGNRRYFDFDVLRAADLDAADKLHPEVATALQDDASWKRARQRLGFFSYFLIDPAGALAQIGAQIGPERSIRTLYRVRVVFPEEELFRTYGQMDQATFGYPIFIAEDTDPA